MHWIAPSEKDTANATLEKRLWDAADQFRANSGPQGAGILRARPRPDLPALRRSPLRRPARQAGEGRRLVPARRRGGRTRRLPRRRRPLPARRSALRPPAAPARSRGHRRQGQRGDARHREAQPAARRRAAQDLQPLHQHAAQGTAQEGLRDPRHAWTTTPSGASTNTSSASSPAPRARRAASSTRRAASSACSSKSSSPSTAASSTPPAAPAACSSSRARFVAEHKKNPAAELAIYGVEKTDETGRLCRLNLAVHGLEGDIRHGGNVNSYYDDPHNATGQLRLRPRQSAVQRQRGGQGAAEGHGRPGPPLPLRPAAHRQRQLPLDSALLLRAERQGPRRLRHGQLRLRRPLLRAGDSGRSSSKPAPWT